MQSARFFSNTSQGILMHPSLTFGRRLNALCYSFFAHIVMIARTRYIAKKKKNPAALSGCARAAVFRGRPPAALAGRPPGARAGDLHACGAQKAQNTRWRCVAHRTTDARPITKALQRTSPFCEFCTTFMSAPETSVSSEGHTCQSPELL